MGIGDRLRYMFKRNKAQTIVGISIFGIVFLFLLIMTINAFTGGAVFGKNKEKSVFIGENIYGKMYYSGDILNGKLAGEGKLSIQNSDYKIELNGIFDNDKFTTGVVSITDYVNRNNSIMIGSFEEDMVSNAFYRFEDADENVAKYEGTIKNGRLDGFGTAYYLLESNNTAVKKTGNFLDGKLVTIQEDIAVPLNVETENNA